jgi:cation diffusion facilitator family transporter
VPENDENTPLLNGNDDINDEEETTSNPKLKEWVPEEDEDTESPVVKVALYMNVSANTVLLVLKIIVAVMTSSLSVVASLVDAALDFVSTIIIWVTSWMISRQDHHAYPVGRRRLEPIGVLVFSVIMITSFVQVGIEGISRLSGPDHTIVALTIPAVAIMASTVVIKGLCWLWCRLIRNSSVQALAQDAMTDVVFNTFSILFPLVGYFARVWWLDSLGGILLSAYVIINWSRTSAEHIRNLTGASATADERNILLYMTMRFAKSIKRIQGLQAYHAGDKLNVEVDIVVDENLALRDSHDLGESLQYVLGKSTWFVEVICVC